MTRWSALLLAGSRGSGGGGLLEGHKALTPVAGQPMLLRPLRALLDSPMIDAVTVLSQQPAELRLALPDDPRIRIDASDATIADTIARLIGRGELAYPVLVTTADHALLDPAMIAEFTGAAAGADLAIGVVEEQVLKARFPNSKRTWIGFRGGRYSGANLFALGSNRVAAVVKRWRLVEQARKRGWRVLAALGPALLLGAVFKLRTAQQSAEAVGRRLGLTVRIVALSDAKAAIDVDKPEDLALVEDILAGRA